jgi:putative nucleotidyltransferase with HDIG domain
LPVFEGTALKLQRMLANPPPTNEPIEQLLASDPVLASAVLRFANSSFFGGLGQARTIRESVLRLGMEQVMRLALVVSQQQSYRVTNRELQPIVNALWRHALATALGCEWLARKLGAPHVPAEGFLAGMVHDIGKLLVIRVVDDLRSTRPDFRPQASLLGELLASLHTKHGAALARQWNLPESYVRVIEVHHAAEPPASDPLAALVRLVDQTVNALGFGLAPKQVVQIAATHEAQQLGVSDLAVAELEIHVEDQMKAIEATPAARA